MDDLKAERAIMEYNMQKNFEKEKSMKFPPDLIAVSSQFCRSKKMKKMLLTCNVAF